MPLQQTMHCQAVSIGKGMTCVLSQEVPRQRERERGLTYRSGRAHFAWIADFESGSNI